MKTCPMLQGTYLSIWECLNLPGRKLKPKTLPTDVDAQCGNDEDFTAQTMKPGICLVFGGGS
jgi:hypothetical protein